MPSTPAVTASALPPTKWRRERPLLFVDIMQLPLLGWRIGNRHCCCSRHHTPAIALRKTDFRNVNVPQQAQCAWLIAIQAVSAEENRSVAEKFREEMVLPERIELLKIAPASLENQGFQPPPMVLCVLVWCANHKG
jgi:hypothetical protein